MATNKIIISYDTDNESATESIIVILGELLPHMVDNVSFKEEVTW